MKVKKNISRAELLEEGKKLDYALIYRMSEVLLIPCAQLKDCYFDDECLEARIFSKHKEYHYFERNGAMQGILVQDCEDEDVIDRKYKLAGRIKEGINKDILCVRSYIEYDDDGQAYTCLTRITALE